MRVGVFASLRAYSCGCPVLYPVGVFFTESLPFRGRSLSRFPSIDTGIETSINRQGFSLVKQRVRHPGAVRGACLILEPVALLK